MDYFIESENHCDALIQTFTDLNRKGLTDSDNERQIHDQCKGSFCDILMSGVKISSDAIRQDDFTHAAFLGLMVHIPIDVKNPLNSMIAVNQKIKEYCGTASNRTKRLLPQIDD